MSSFSVGKVYVVYFGGEHFIEFDSVWNTEQAAVQYIKSKNDNSYSLEEVDLLDMPDTNNYKCSMCKDTGLMGERETCYCEWPQFKKEE